MQVFNIDDEVYVADRKTNKVFKGVINLILNKNYFVFIPDLNMSFKFLGNEIHKTYKEAYNNPL